MALDGRHPPRLTESAVRAAGEYLEDKGGDPEKRAGQTPSGEGRRRRHRGLAGRCGLYRPERNESVALTSAGNPDFAVPRGHDDPDDDADGISVGEPGDH